VAECRECAQGRGVKVSVRLELDNGNVKEYTTMWTNYGSEGYYPEKPYHTKCGLSFKKYPEDGACDHLECAISAARDEAIYPIGMYCMFSIMMIAAGWYEKGDLLDGIQDSRGILIICGPILGLFSLISFRRWMELREYRDRGTIHGRKARKL